MKGLKHDWKPKHDGYAEGRRCTRCGAHQYVYGTTKGRILFWLPKVGACKRK